MINEGAQHMRCAVFVAIVAALSGGLAAQSRPSATSPGALTDDQKAGRRILQTRCAMCHVAEDPGTEAERAVARGPFGPLLSNARVLADEAAVREKILNGGPQMPAYKYSLTASEVTQIVAFMKTLQRPLTKLAADHPDD
jgi:mono/diheme cytochrome c family protein